MIIMPIRYFCLLFIKGLVVCLRLSLFDTKFEEIEPYSWWKVYWVITLYELGCVTCSIYLQPFEVPRKAECDCNFCNGCPGGGKEKALWLDPIARTKAVLLPEWMVPIPCVALKLNSRIKN